MESDTYQELNICPAAIYLRRVQDKETNFWERLGDKMGNPWVCVPSVTNEKEESLEDMKVDDDGEYYYSVQDAMQGSADETTTEGKMPVAFQAENVYNLKSHGAVAYNGELDGEDKKYRVPILYTDYRMYNSILLSTEKASLSLEAMPAVSSGRSFGNGSRITML